MIRCLRSVLLSLAAAAFGESMLSTSFADVLEIKQPGMTIRANRWNDVQLVNDAGQTLVTFTGFHAKWKPKQDTVGGTIRQIETAEGQNALEVTYQTKAEADEQPITIVGRFTVFPGRVDVQYDLTNVPQSKETNFSGSMFGRRLAKDAQELAPVKLGLWQRHQFGGVPYEIRDGTLLRYQVGAAQICFAYDGSSRPNFSWKDAGSQHVTLTKVTPDHYAGHFSVLMPPADWSPEAISAQWHNRPVCLNIGTDKAFNWWPDGKEPLAIKTNITNTSMETRDIEVSYWVRDYSGDIVGQNKATVTLNPGQTYREPVQVKTPAARALMFAEVSARDLKTGQEVFARTNLAILPPHEFRSTLDDSIFGLAAYWPYPTEGDVQNLMDRMGVRWLRGGDSRIQHAPRIANRHTGVDLNKEWTAEARDEWIKKQLAQCVEDQNPAWEFCNEINMSTAGIAMEGGGIGKALLAEKYVEWVKAIRRVQKETGTTQIKLLSFGVAGMDVRFWQRIYELGAWGDLDGMCLHPGRGNFAPDYPVSEPWDKWVVGSYGNYWNYYGSVRTAAKMIKDYGGKKDLWLTEVYTPGFPNSFWEDTPRNAAENALLQLALAKAEGVKAAMWYQLNDSVWFDQLGINPKDREYYFGLTNRDLSFKPSLMGFITAAEALDQAKFERWIKMGDDKNRGLLFSTPRGPMAILWNRTDGYILTKKVENYATPEPWIDTWKTKTPTEIPASGKEVRLINPIGVEKIISTSGGKAKIVLDGAPVIVYGIDADKLK